MFFHSIFNQGGKFLCTLLLFFVSGVIQAQDDLEINSLKNTLSTAQNDTNKVNTYLDLVYAYQWSYPDSALLYAVPGLALAKKLNYRKGELNILSPMAEALSMKGNYSKALEYRFQALELAKQLNNPEEIANALVLTGLVYHYSKDYQKALVYFYKGKATNAVTLGGPKILFGFIGESYFHLNQLDSALFYIQKAYALDVKDTTFHWSVPYQYLAAIYEKKGDFQKAIGFYKESFTISYNNADRFNDYNGIAAVYKKTGQLDSAIFYAKKVIAGGATASMPAPVIEASLLLSNIYKSSNDIDSAFKYQELLLTARDSLFSQEKIRQLQNVAFDEQVRQQEIETGKVQYQNKLRLYGTLAAFVIFIIIGAILWRNIQIKQRANALLSRKNEEVESTLSELKATQAQLIQSEKMASLGELTAGIAHEIQNPLNFVNNFSEVNSELISDLKEEIDKGNLEEAKDIANDLAENEQKIAHHGKRADSIVKGMLQHSRTSTGKKEPTDINALCDEYLRLSYHGLRAKDKSFNAALETNFDETIEKINIIPQDIGRVLLNLFNNAFYAVHEHLKKLGAGFEPLVIVTTKKKADTIEIKVKDNGMGILKSLQDKIFQPFFTTKAAGQGTGLGLSLSYDIIKAHGGELTVESEEGEGATFIIQLPA